MREGGRKWSASAAAVQFPIWNEENVAQLDRIAMRHLISQQSKLNKTVRDTIDYLSYKLCTYWSLASPLPTYLEKIQSYLDIEFDTVYVL